MLSVRCQSPVPLGGGMGAQVVPATCRIILPPQVGAFTQNVVNLAVLDDQTTNQSEAHRFVRQSRSRSHFLHLLLHLSSRQKFVHWWLRARTSVRASGSLDALMRVCGTFALMTADSLNWLCFSGARVARGEANFYTTSGAPFSRL